MAKMADFTGILLKNLGQISPEYEKEAAILWKFSGQWKKEIGFALFSQMFLMKQNGNFFWGGGWEMMSINLCNNNNNRNINFL